MKSKFQTALCEPASDLFTGRNRWDVWLSFLTDIDECSQSIGSLCAFQCVNVAGSYQCSCPPHGYVMAANGRTCRGEPLVCHLLSRQFSKFLLLQVLHFEFAFFISSLIISQIFLPPTLGCQTTHLDSASYRNTKVGSKAITIMQHYHSSSSINTGNNHQLPAPEITAPTDI